MNILALDCAVTCITVAVKTDDKFISHTYDIGMKQSEILIPVIDQVLAKAKISASNLNYSALTIGPGSFTGLRLGISALKALELAYNVPVYGISSLKVYSYAWESLGLPVLSCIDANKDKFYARICDNEKILLEDGDYELCDIADKVSTLEKVIVAGPDSKKLYDLLKEKTVKSQLLLPNSHAQTGLSLISLAEEMINKGLPPLKDFEGPVYLRASEAELALKAKE